MLKVLKTIYKDEYKVSHILIKTNPMQDIDKVKRENYID